MKYIKEYKLFESISSSKDFFYDKVNHKLIQDLKDLSLSLFDDNEDLCLVYGIDTKNQKIMYGFYRTKDEKIKIHNDISDFEREIALSRRLPKEIEHWMRYYKPYLIKSIDEYKSGGLKYHFLLHKGEAGTSDFEILHGEEVQEILDILRERYPDERIDIST